MFFSVKQYSHIRGRTCIAYHVQPAYLLTPPNAPQGSVSAGLPVTPGNVCVCGCGVLWMKLQTDLRSPVSSLWLSVCISVVKSMVSCCSGSVLFLSLSPEAC